MTEPGLQADLPAARPLTYGDALMIISRRTSGAHQRGRTSRLAPPRRRHRPPKRAARAVAPRLAAPAIAST